MNHAPRLFQTAIFNCFRSRSISPWSTAAGPCRVHPPISITCVRSLSFIGLSFLAKASSSPKRASWSTLRALHVQKPALKFQQILASRRWIYFGTRSYAVTSILAAEQGAVMPRQMSVFTHAGAAGLHALAVLRRRFTIIVTT